jgi:hypothetical protein
MKLEAPLTKKMIFELADLYECDMQRPEGVNIFDFSIGQLYERGILQIRKRVENGVFVFFISLTETGKELLEQSEYSMRPVY